MLRHILQADHAGRRYAVIVNDMSELNVDGSLVKAHVQHEKEQLVEMSNGCICCTLREDLLKEVASLARSGRFDHLIIESTGVSEPLPVAETFLFETDADGPEGEGGGAKESLLDLAEIDSMVTVVDAVSFLNDLVKAEDLSSRGQAVDENDTRTITDLLVSQVEFASVIVINKCDLVDANELLRVKQAVAALNSEARILCTTRSKVDISEIVGSKSYDFDKVSQSATWLRAINNPEEKLPETEEYGISSFVYRARQPFHPTRLMNFINSRLSSLSSDQDNEDNEDEEDEEDGGDVGGEDGPAPHIIRSKGFFWLASRPEEAMVWSQAGGLFSLTPGGAWWADVPRDLWPTDPAERQDIEKDWCDEGGVGDRRQELVFIGTNMQQQRTKGELDACLLTAEEQQGGREAWRRLEDPFPEAEEFNEDEGEGEGGGEKAEVTMILPSAKKQG